MQYSELLLATGWQAAGSRKFWGLKIELLIGYQTGLSETDDLISSFCRYKNPLIIIIETIET